MVVNKIYCLPSSQISKRLFDCTKEMTGYEEHFTIIRNEKGILCWYNEDLERKKNLHNLQDEDDIVTTIPMENHEIAENNVCHVCLRSMKTIEMGEQWVLQVGGKTPHLSCGLCG